MLFSFLLIATSLAASARAADAPTPDELRAALEKLDSPFLSFRDEPAAKPGEVELGRKLFFDPRLSRDRVLSCSSCHQPALAWTDGLPKARGKLQKVTQRNTPSLLGVAGHAPFFRDGRAPTLEAQALMPIQDPNELDFTIPELLERLESVPGYARDFRAVYGGEATGPRIASALAAFERTIQPKRDSAFDRFRAGDAALPAPAARGLVLFTGKARCVLCHPGVDFTDDFFHNVGEKRVAGDSDAGRFSFIPVDYAFRAFKTPSLRDVALTAPYLHDGSLPDLRAAVDFYDRAGDQAEGRDRLLKPLNLSEREKRDLVAFLEALTSTPQEVPAPLLPPDDDPESSRAGLGPRVEAVVSAAEHGLDTALRDRARDLEWHAQALRLELEAAGQAPSCLGDVESRARRLGFGPPVDDARARARSLARAWERCALPLGEAAQESAADLGGAAAAATRAEALLTAPLPPDADETRCREKFSPDAYAADLRAGKFDGELTDALVKATFDDLMRWRGYAALRSGDPRDCAQLKGLKRTYNGLQVEAETSCREWTGAARFSRALMRRDPDFRSACLISLRQGYSVMSSSDIEETCAAIARDIDEPAKLCGELIPARLSPDRLSACIAEFSRYAAPGKPAAGCAGLEAGAEVLRERCGALSGLRRARDGGGAAACGSSDLCRALYGDYAGPEARLKSRMSSFACALLSGAALSARHSDLDMAGRALDSARAGIAAAESARAPGDRGAAAAVDALAERVARLDARQQAQLSALPAASRGELDPMAPATGSIP
jgi:cytochrome c peroxidase